MRDDPPLLLVCGTASARTGDVALDDFCCVWTIELTAAVLFRRLAACCAVCNRLTLFALVLVIESTMVFPLRLWKEAYPVLGF